MCRFLDNNRRSVVVGGEILEKEIVILFQILVNEKKKQFHCLFVFAASCILFIDNYQLLDEVEQNITICRWRADQLFADAEGRGK